MELTNVVLAVIGLIAAVAVPVAIHRATHPKRRVSYFVSARPQVPVPLPPGQRDARRMTPPPGWPMLVTLSVFSSGRADVPSALFDGGRPIAFRFGSPIRGVKTDPAEFPGFGGFEIEDADRLVFPPTLIGADRTFTAEVAVDWPVTCTVRHPLIDVQVLETHTPPDRTRATAGTRRFTHNGMFWGVAQLVLGFALMVIAVAVASAGAPIVVPLALAYTLLIMSGAATIAITAVARLVRWLVNRAQQRRTEPQPSAASDGSA